LAVHAITQDLSLDPEQISGEAETLAIAIERGRGRQTVRHSVWQFVEAEIDPLRVQKSGHRRSGRSWTNRATTEAHSKLNENLAKLDRYLRRASSRRKRALHVMMTRES
jgi:hypothetical protein